MNKRKINHPLRHLNQQNSEPWMGLVDGIYAIAMTLIAIELPELADSLLKADAKAFELGPLTAIFIYELTAYTTTFLILYELWTFHKAILFLAGLRKHTQNLINGLILAITCLGAGNVIVILKAKNETSTRALEQGATHSDLMKSWIGNSDQLVLVNVLIVAFSFLMMSELARYSDSYATSNDLRGLQRSSLRRAIVFLVFTVNWLPLLLGHQQPLIPPAIAVVLYLAVTNRARSS